MTPPMTLTLAAWQDLIWIVVFAAVMLGSALSNLKKKSQEQRKRDEGDSVRDLEQMAARRREELRQMSSGRAQAQGPVGSAGEPGNLTMAERIARARAKAQYEQRAQHGAQRGQRARPQEPNDAQRRALAQRRAELERRQQAANAQQQAQQRARQQAQQRARLQAQQQAQAAQARQQRAQTHARAQAQARQRGTLIHERVMAPEPTESTTHRLIPDATTPKRSSPIGSAAPTRASVTGLLASISRNDLRKAIIFKEVLGKPIALREGETY